MSKLEQVVSEAVRAGKLTVPEALAINAAANWVVELSWNSVAMDAFKDRYGALALRELPGLIGEVK